MKYASAILIACLCATASCAGGDKSEVISAGERYVSSANSVEDYRLGIGDRLRVTVYNEENLSGEFAVGANGAVSLTLIGDVPVLGLRPSDVAAEAQRRLADGYLQSPKVSAEVVMYRPFYILGEVGAAGQYPYTVGMTAVNAVATAKGFTPRSNRGVVRIRREGATEEQKYKLTPDLRIYPGDTIRVGERFF